MGDKLSKQICVFWLLSCIGLGNRVTTWESDRKSYYLLIVSCRRRHSQRYFKQMFRRVFDDYGNILTAVKLRNNFLSFSKIAKYFSGNWTVCDYTGTQM